MSGDGDERTLFERIVAEARKVGGALTEKVTSSLTAAYGPPELRATTATCPGCGRTLKMRRRNKRTVESLAGETTIERPYFHCGKCRHGFHPADAALGLAPGVKQFDLQRKAAILAAELPFERAAVLFKEMTGHEMSSQVVHDTTNETASGLGVLDVAPTREEIRAKIIALTKPGAPLPVLEILIDGAMTPTRPDKARGGRDGPKKIRANRAKWKGEWREEKGFRLCVLRGDRIEHLLSWHGIMTHDELFADLRRVKEAGLIPADLARLCVAGDGAKWIWDGADELLSGVRQALDYWHMKEHLHEFADIKYGQGSERAGAWVEATKSRICAGNAGLVIAGLRRMCDDRPAAVKAAENLETYLTANKHRMDYDALRAEGFPLGSGAIDSSHKFINHVRLKRSGAWWYPDNSDHILALRCALYNGTFDRVFARYQKLVLKRKCPKNASATLKRILAEAV